MVTRWEALEAGLRHCHFERRFGARAENLATRIDIHFAVSNPVSLDFGIEIDESLAVKASQLGAFPRWRIQA
jgi:hypothetical protein